jgi:hypothetical protein
LSLFKHVHSANGKNAATLGLFFHVLESLLFLILARMETKPPSLSRSCVSSRDQHRVGVTLIIKLLPPNGFDGEMPCCMDLLLTYPFFFVLIFRRCFVYGRVRVPLEGPR